MAGSEQASLGYQSLLPPASVHDCMSVNTQPEHIEAWLNPDPDNLQALYAIFDDKPHPFYEHKVAA